MNLTSAQLPLVLALAFAPFASSQCQRETPSLVRDSSRVLRDTRGGGGVAFHLDSRVLGQSRKIDVTLPQSFAQTPSTRRYPVIVLLDGEAYLGSTAVVVNELSDNGLIPEAIIVAIENSDQTRGRVHDLTPPGLSVSGSSLNEGGDTFLDFIEQEVLPAVDRQFRGGGPRVLIGHSSGAILATWAAATRPRFRAVVAIDAPIELGGNWLAKQLLARAKRDSTPLRFSYFQARFPWPADAWTALESAAPTSWKLHKDILKHEGHETAFMLGAYLGLRESFVDYSRLAAPVTPTTSILPYYAAVSVSFGDTLVPSKRIFRDVIDDLLMEGRGLEARNAYRAFVSAYGPPADNADLVAEITEVEKQPPPTETVESLLNAPAPTPEAARAYLGEWVGEVSRGPDAPRERNTLTVRVEAGKVVVELGNPDGPPAMRVRRMDHVRVTKDGLTFGRLNGMRPRGVYLYEGVLRGDTLSGKTRWGGIAFREPGAMGQTGFTFTRVKR